MKTLVLYLIILFNANSDPERGYSIEIDNQFYEANTKKELAYELRQYNSLQGCIGDMPTDYVCDSCWVKIYGNE